MAASRARRAADTEARRARVAVFGLFFVNAVLYANLVPRYPEVRARLDLSNAALGTAIAAMPAGALLAGFVAPRLIRRFGSGPTASAGLVALGAAIAAIPFARAWGVFAAIMLGVGALDAVIDVAQNAHGFRVQRRYGRSIVNAFHGFWSVGAVSGGLLGSAAAGLGVALDVHLATSAVVFGGVALVTSRFLLRGGEDAERAPETPVDGAPTLDAGRRTRRILAALGLLAACGALVEDAGASWGAIYLRDVVGSSIGTAGLAFVALQVAMTAARLTGDRVVDRFGRRAVAVGGGMAVIVGVGMVLSLATLGATIVGFALAGLGVGTLVPAVMHTADELPGLRRGVGLAIVSSLLRVGFLVSPPVVGLVADAASLRVALLGVVLAGGVIVVFGRVLATGTTAPRVEHVRSTPPG